MVDQISDISTQAFSDSQDGLIGEEKKGPREMSLCHVILFLRNTRKLMCERKMKMDETKRSDQK
jgi:hypothetical protein